MRLNVLSLVVGYQLLLSTPFVARAEPDRSNWVATWSAAMQAPLFVPAQVISDQTLRQIVRTSIGGNLVRVRFSNAYGTTPLVIDAASIGRRAEGSALVPGSARPLEFAGAPSISIAPGAVVLSDPASLRVPDRSDLAVDVYVAAASAASTQLTLSHQTSYLSQPGNHAGSTTLEPASTIESWYWLSGIEVDRSEARAVVAFGDSITEGWGSTTDQNSRWPDVLARRARACASPTAVVNTAISGNRLLNDELGPNAQRRLDADLLLQAGARIAIVLEGINDIGFSQAGDFLPESVVTPDVSADELIAAYTQIIRRGHAAGIRVYGGTLLPYAGADYFDEAGEAKRQAVNAWIRESGAFDAVIDFDAIMRDPADPSRLLAAYDSGDRLHPNDAGYKAMGEAIDLRLICGQR